MSPVISWFCLLLCELQFLFLIQFSFYYSKLVPPGFYSSDIETPAQRAFLFLKVSSERTTPGYDWIKLYQAPLPALVTLLKGCGSLTHQPWVKCPPWICKCSHPTQIMWAGSGAGMVLQDKFGKMDAY